MHPYIATFMKYIFISLLHKDSKFFQIGRLENLNRDANLDTGLISQNLTQLQLSLIASVFAG